MNEPDDDLVEKTEDYEPDYEEMIESWEYNYGNHDEPELFPYAEPY